jgi:hypothetical protein
MRTAFVLGCLTLAALSPTQGLADEDPAHPRAEHQADDIGTDPTRVSRSVQLKYEHIAYRQGFSSDTLRLWYTQPLGNGFSVGFKLPVTQVDLPNGNGSGLGDVSILAGKVFGLTKDGGHVLQAEVFFDTATRPELGAGNSVLKATYVRALFLENHDIFAPSFVQSVSLMSGNNRPKINLTTVDFYYVPKMDDPRNLVTFDPNLNYNWENGNRFAGLAVTLGRNIGPSPFGGNHFVLLKPAILVGGDRPNKWGLELTYKVIGF